MLLSGPDVCGTSLIPDMDKHFLVVSAHFRLWLNFVLNILVPSTDITVQTYLCTEHNLIFSQFIFYYFFMPYRLGLISRSPRGTAAIFPQLTFGLTRHFSLQLESKTLTCPCSLGTEVSFDLNVGW